MFCRSLSFKARLYGAVFAAFAATLALPNWAFASSGITNLHPVVAHTNHGLMVHPLNLVLAIICATAAALFFVQTWNLRRGHKVGMVPSMLIFFFEAFTAYLNFHLSGFSVLDSVLLLAAFLVLGLAIWLGLKLPTKIKEWRSSPERVAARESRTNEVLQRIAQGLKDNPDLERLESLRDQLGVLSLRSQAGIAKAQRIKILLEQRIEKERSAEELASLAWIENELSQTNRSSDAKEPNGQ